MLGLTQIYRTLTLPKVAATVVSTRDRGDEDCYEFAYDVQGQPYRSWYCSQNYRPSNYGVVVRVDPAHPSEATPAQSSDMITTFMLWGLFPFVGWMPLTMYVHGHLSEYLEERRRKRRQERKRQDRGKKRTPPRGT